uniref:Uncharacterized protein n=1 Tax=Euplotes crassus TaxID=5936 RepID=A0A7S3NTE1_EUPCR|mmetsp:Transcript_18974/g.18646  ORF Transcript_18974/g.18646 Transcript_18974/m.18646 type:complete len:162 (+) Transcript_18974:1-486(+)
MEPPFKPMVDEHPDVQITLHTNDPNASSNKIIMDKAQSKVKLFRKSDLTDKIVVDGSGEEPQMDTDYNSSPHRYSNTLEDENVMTNKHHPELGDDFNTASVSASPKSVGSLPMVNYFVPLSISPSYIMDVFNQTSVLQKFQIIEKEDAFSTAVHREAFSLK